MAELKAGQPLSGPLAEALARGREDFNTRFAYARSTNRRLAPDEFFRHLIHIVDPIVRAVHDLDGALVDPVVDALYDLSLELMGRDCLGDDVRHPLVVDVWQTLLPSVSGLLAINPRRVAASLSNAAYNLSIQPRADGKRWLQGMLEFASICRDNVGRFLRLGQVLAWRVGLTHYRDSALEVWRELPDSMKGIALGFAPNEDHPDAGELEKRLANPWVHPIHKVQGSQTWSLDLVGQVGGFRGFGGPFVSPPEVTSVDGTLFAFDNEACWSIHADCFGSTLQRYGRDIPPDAGNAPGEFILIDDGIVVKGDISLKIPAFVNHSSYCGNQHTLAVTLARSHHVFLVALVPAQSN